MVAFAHHLTDAYGYLVEPQKAENHEIEALKFMGPVGSLARNIPNGPSNFARGLMNNRILVAYSPRVGREGDA